MSDHNYTDDSRRGFMKKGALAASALALGAGASGTASAQEQPEGLVFAYDYHPGRDFEVLAQLELSTTIEILQDEGETVDELPSPTDYTGHVIRYDADESAGITGFLFSEDVSLSQGDSGTLGEDASVFSPELNLLSAALEGNGNGDAEPTDEEEQEEEEETPTGDGGGAANESSGGQGG